MTIHLLLIRHARSTSNAAGTLAGRSDGIELDDEGRQQARMLIERLGAVTPSMVVGSPLPRCRQTMEPALAAWGLEYRVDQRLNECDYGIWTGRTLSECATDPLWQTIQNRPGEVIFPEGEGMTDMSQRVNTAVDELISQAEDGAVIVIVSHGDPIKAIVARQLGLDLNDFQKIVIDPASITVLRVADDRSFVVRLNDTQTPIAGLVQSISEATPGGGAGAGGTPHGPTAGPIAS